MSSEHGDGDTNRRVNRGGNRDNQYRNHGQGRDRRNYNPNHGQRSWNRSEQQPTKSFFSSGSGRKSYVGSNTSSTGSYINPRQPSGAIAGFGALPMSQNSTYSVRSEFRPRQYDETKSYYIPPSHHPINPMAYASGEPPNTAAFAYNPTFHTMFDPQHFNVGSSPLFYCGPKQAIIDEEERNDFGVSRMTQEEVAAALIEKLKTEEMKKMKDRADKEELIENKQFASEEKPKVVEKTITEPVPEKPLVVEKAVEEKHSDNLRQELINAFNKGLDGTFVFKVDSEEVKVSKMFFAAQSKAFTDLMLSDSNEAKTSKTSFDNLHLEAVQRFVDFIHSGRVEHLDRYVDEVLLLAKKFNVKELKTICVKRLESRPLNDDNILQSLINAFERQDDKLKKSALDYMAQSTSGKDFLSIMLADEWFEFQMKNPQLARDITKTALSK